jgi:hypothetical protein
MIRAAAFNTGLRVLIYMSVDLEFGYGNSLGNNSAFAGPRSWVRTKNGAGVGTTHYRERPKDPS